MRNAYNIRNENKTETFDREMNIAGKIFANESHKNKQI